jgi:hypothetical protein
MLDCLDDIASDFSVFHRIDDCNALDGPTYFRLAWRLPAYAGVMQARALAAQSADQPRPSQGDSGAARRQEINPGTRATLMAEPAFQGIFSFG